jgi:LmbE family N-acetylglucosaminyl deacetylase
MAKNKKPTKRKKPITAPLIGSASMHQTPVKAKNRSAGKPQNKRPVTRKPVAVSDATIGPPSDETAIIPQPERALDQQTDTSDTPAEPLEAAPVVSEVAPTGEISAETARPSHVGKVFAAGSFVVLILTTLFWTVLTARLHQANADQLIDGYLFENWQTFQSATFPGAHTFLIKWPIFAAMQLFGTTPRVFMTVTISMVMLTVAATAYILHRIVRRPAVWGLLCLALSSVLLLVPAQPAAGVLLPANMAMTTTRNIEYIVFIALVYLVTRLTRIRSLAFLAVVAVAVLLVASDKLFAVLAVGGGLFAAVWYLAVIRRRADAVSSGRIIVVALLGLLLCSGLLLLLDRLNLTHIGNGQTASPYPLVHSARQVGLGLAFSVGAVLTNFGANPVHGVMILRDIPAALLNSLRHISIIAYAANFLLLSAAVVASVKLLFSRPATGTDGVPGSDDGAGHWRRLSIILLGATLAAAAVYVLTDHYYPVDARYLTIALFAVTIAAATFLRGRELPYRQLVASAVVLVAVIPVGMTTSWHEYRADSDAMAGRSRVTAQVSDELQRHKVDRLVGDYWDVTPAKAASARPVTIAPIDKCTLPRPALNSSAWFEKPAKTSTAYLAIRDGSPMAGPDGITQSDDTATYGGCSLAHVVGMYGVPTERVVINQATGQQFAPDVLLLLYPGGFKPPVTAPAVVPAAVTDTASPVLSKPVISPLVPFSEHEICSRGLTLQVVAHQDDDLLFMNPDLLGTIKDGGCVRTVYLTAGDAGESAAYWSGREQGAKAAYAHMYGVVDTWHEEQQLLDGHLVTVDYLADIPQVALVFMRLPDGNMRGEGFAADGDQSLHKLMSGEITKINTVDKAASYTRQDIVTALQDIMAADSPDTIRTQGSSDLADGDHSDHHAAGILTDEAVRGYQEPFTINHYIGYPDKAFPVNISDDDLVLKQAAFLTYAKFDGAVCQSAFECQQTYTYGSYLSRQYKP